MGTGRRAFLKVFPERAINGAIGSCHIITAGVFWRLLFRVGDDEWSDYGIYAISPRMGYTDEQIAERLGIEVDVWLQAKEWLSGWHDKEKPLIAVLDANVIAIVHWSKYQPPYDRTKKYKHPDIRQTYEWVYQKVQEKVQELKPPKGTPEGTAKASGRD